MDEECVQMPGYGRGVLGGDAVNRQDINRAMAAKEAAARAQYKGNTTAPQTQFDALRAESERVTLRLSAVRRRLIALGERIVGEGPANGCEQASDAMTTGAFLPSTARAIDLAHIELSQIEDLLAGFEQTI